MLGVSVACFCFIPRIFGIRVAINIDGLEWQRRKWGGLVARYLKFSEKMAGVTANAVITDARWIQDYYLREYRKEAVYIAYGADIMYYPPNETLERYQLEKNGYILYVGRFDPENNALVVREAYDEMREARKKLVMVGDAPYAGDYIRRLKDTQNNDIVFTGYLFGQGYREIQSNAYLYIQAGEVGGTHLALLEAMGAGNCILANDVPEHREVLGEAGIYYNGKEDLKEKMEMLLSNDALVNEKREAARTIVRKKYSWERITAEYETLFRRILDRKKI
jgi:glycosyltransferase involved in cell wall biosynthesis